jgi:hypothetical protein
MYKTLITPHVKIINNKMNNLFTKNSRFDVLYEEGDEWKYVTKKNKKEKKDNLITEEPKTNSFKNDRPQRQNYRENNSFHANDKKWLEEKNKEAEKLKKQKEIEESLKESNFPDLDPSGTIKKTFYEETKPPTVSFIDKLKKDNLKEEKYKEEETVKPGCVCLTLDPTNKRKVIYKYGKSLYESKPEISKPIDVLNALVALHEKRKKEYIQFWGEEEYERMFRMPNYDYEYFDRLDEQYEEEMEALEQEKYNKNEEYDSY